MNKKEKLCLFTWEVYDPYEQTTEQIRVLGSNVVSCLKTLGKEYRLKNKILISDKPIEVKELTDKELNDFIDSLTFKIVPAFNGYPR